MKPVIYFRLSLLFLPLALDAACAGEETTQTFIPASLDVPAFIPPAPSVQKEVPAMRVDSAINVPSKDSRTLTLIRAEASTLPDLPVPPVAEAVESKTFTEENRNLVADQRRHTLQVGASIFDHRVSVVHWQHPDTGESYEAACGFDIGLLEGIGQFVRDGETYSVMLMHSAYDAEQSRSLAKEMFPNLPDVQSDSITFLKGNPKDPVGTATITLLKDLIVSEKTRLVAYQAARLQLQQEAAEWKKANPPVPRDETFWLKPHRGSRYLADPKPEASAK